MPRRRAEARRNRRWLVLADAIGVLCALAIGSALLDGGLGVGTEAPSTSVGLWALAFAPIYVVAFVVYRLYARSHRRVEPTIFPDLPYLGHALLAAGLGTLAASHFLNSHAPSVPRLSLTGVVVCTLPCLATVPGARAALNALTRRRGGVTSRVIVLGSGHVADTVIRRLQTSDEIEFVGIVDDDWAETNHGDCVTLAGPVLGSIEDLPRLCDELAVDRVMVAFSWTKAPGLADALRQLPRTVQISVVPRLFDLVTWRSSVDEFLGLPMLDIARPVLGPGQRALKRSLDVAGALAALVLFAPIWLFAALAIKLTSPGPVFFKQLRTGYLGEPFLIYKFRTMRLAADEEKASLQGENEVDGPLFKIREDPRVTRIGRILRATSIDELPQLLNVIKGDMSLVGPRPFVVAEARLIDGWAVRRFDVRPGMTGLWQVSGRNDLSFEELRRLDYSYVASWSIWWDLKILWNTPASVLRGRGAS